MLILSVILGLLVGVLLNWASDYLVRFSASAQPLSASSPRPITSALWQSAAFRLAHKTALPKDWKLHIGVELLNAAAFGFLYQKYGVSTDLLFYALIFCFLLIIAEVDLKYRLVLNVLTYPAMATVVIGQLLAARHSVLSMLLGGGLAFGIFFLTMRLRPGDLGGGDVKLGTLLGLAFGFPGVLWALLAGAGSGAIVAIVLSLRRRTDDKFYFPYAPFLCFGAMVALLYSPFLMSL